MLTRDLLSCTDLEHRPRAWELDQRRIVRIEKTGRTAGPAAGVAHRAVIDGIGRADERLVTGIVAGKVLEAEMERQVLVLVEVDQLDFMPDFGGGRVGVRWREAEIAFEAV